VSSSGRDLALVTPPPPGRPRRVLEHPGRFAIVAVGIMVVLSLFTIVALSADTSPREEDDPLPSEVVSLRPGPSTLAKPQQAISVTLRDDLTGVLVVDGLEIPEDQLARPTQSSFSFQPGPEKELTRFSSGSHRVDVVYWPAVRTRDDAETFSYTFRTTA
jgi:hypothetical protein